MEKAINKKVFAGLFFRGKCNWLLNPFFQFVIFAACILTFISASPDNSQLTRGEFVSTIAKNQPDHPFLPQNHAKLSQEELYTKTANILKIRGFKVLVEKDPKEMMTEQEFVRVAYALSGEAPGKNLFEQKLFLKEQGVVKSADVGIATGAEGKILQFHKGEKKPENVQLASPVFMNDRIKTKGDSEASFTFDDRSSLTIGENSNIRIKKHIYDPEKDLRQTVVNITEGTVRFVVTKGKAKGSSFKVVTPTAVAGVRGTEFVVVVDNTGKTSFIGISGSIETAAILANGQLGKKSIVAKGQVQEIAKGAIASVVKSDNGKALGKLKNMGKGKGKGKFKEKGVKRGRVVKTAKRKFLNKDEVEKRGKKSDTKFASLRGGNIKPVKTTKFKPSFKPGKVAKNLGKKAAKREAKGKVRVVGQNKSSKGGRPSAPGSNGCNANNAGKKPGC